MKCCYYWQIVLIIGLCLGFATNSVTANAKAAVGPRIVGGTEAAISSYPSAVQLYYNGKYFCCGVLVSVMHVLTAAHCLFNKPATGITAIVGQTSLYNATAVRAKGEKHFRKGTFSMSTLTDDIAILKLAKAVKGTNIAKTVIPNTKPSWSVGSSVVVAGWGSPQEGLNPTKNLRKVTLTLISYARCKAIYGDELPSNAFCTLTSGKDACTGDSGCGVWYNGQLVGIVSGGRGCARSGYPGYYTLVNYHRPWIIRVVNANF